MSDMKELAQLMRQLEEQLVVCNRCGLCQAVCPLYGETGREADVARGKLALLDGLFKQQFKEADGVLERLNRCLLCGSCQANCPSGVNVLEIFMKARMILTEFRGLSPAKKLIFRGMLARPALFDRVAALGSRFQALGIKSANPSMGTSCSRFITPMLGDRHFMPLAAVPFHKQVTALNTPKGKSGLRVALYVGCLGDKIYPKLPRATIDVLTYHGVGIYMPENQACCGIPAVASGDRKTFERLVRHNVDRFDPTDFDYLVTACATCTSTIKKVWPALISQDSDIGSKVAQISEKTMDINQFLVSVVGLQIPNRKNGNTAVPVTYHDPCHLKKSLNVATEPRAVIEACSGYSVTEMTDADVCCGMGGSFNLQYYETSCNIGHRKLDNIIATGCSIVATGCPACMMQLTDMVSHSGKNIAVKHPIELYAETLKNNAGQIKTDKSQKHFRSGL